MANFTSDIRQEIIARGFQSREDKRSALSAFLRASGALSYDFSAKQYGFEFVTESEDAAEFFLGIIEELYGAAFVSTVKSDRLSGKEKLRFEFKGDGTEELLCDVGILKKTAGGSELLLKVKGDLVASEGRAIAFVKGAFLGGGSCTLPVSGGKTGYHLQFVLQNEQIARDLAGVLCSFDILSKQIEHKGLSVVYFNSKETISDFLSVIGLDGALGRLSEVVEQRDFANNANRSSNCVSGNAGRKQRASAAQYKAIESICERIGVDALPDSLRDLARARLKDKDASLQEIADALNVSKSCVSHRMKKLMEIYDSLEK